MHLLVAGGLAAVVWALCFLYARERREWTTYGFGVAAFTSLLIALSLWIAANEQVFARPDQAHALGCLFGLMFASLLRLQIIIWCTDLSVRVFADDQHPNRRFLSIHNG